MKDLDRTDGEVDALLGRIASIRTWTYLSQRSSWVPDPRFWQERTRAVEDRLSDALHERLTQEFVDRPGTVIARHDPSDLVTSIGPDGEVLVQGLRAGEIEGFRFRPDRVGSEGSRGLLAAANRALRTLVRERVQALEADPDEAFALGPGAELLWHGAPVARLTAGEAALAPQVDVLATELLDPPLRERVRRRLAAWLDAHLRAGPRGRSSRCGRRRRQAPCAGSRSCSARGSAPWRAGRWRRRSRRSRPTSGARSSRLGVNLGRFSVFLPALQHPEALRLRARLFAVRHGLPSATGPDGSPSVPNDLARPLGVLPRLRLSARSARARCGSTVSSARRRSSRGSRAPARSSRRGSWPAILGCRAAELPAVLSAMGYVERDGRYERRAPRAGERVARGA